MLKWQGTVDRVGPREKAIQEALGVQRNNDALRRLFAAAADKFVNWSSSIRGELSRGSSAAAGGSSSTSSSSGTDASTLLAQAQGVRDKSQAEGPALYDATSKAARDMLDAGITENTLSHHTSDSVNVEWQSLQSLINKTVSQLTSHRDEEFRLAQLSEARKAEWIQTFKHFDKDNSVTLEAHEFKAALSAMGIDYSDETFQELWKGMRRDESGNLTQSEFLGWMAVNVGDQDSKFSVEKALAALGDGKGNVTGAKLAKVLPPDVLAWIKPKLKPVDGQPDTYSYADFLGQAFPVK